MKHTSEWKFVRKNSKGEAVLRRDTNETLEEVLDFLKDKELEVEVFSKATLISIYVEWRRYDYYWTTGRWCQRKKTDYPTKHYHSKGIEDFFNRFLKKDIRNSEEVFNETH